MATNMRDIPLGKLEHSDNYRENVQVDADFVASIRANGVLEPLVVTPTKKGYQVVAGDRRLTGAKQAHLKAVPCVVLTGRAKPGKKPPPLTRAECLAVAVVENTQRRDPSAVEDSDAVVALQREGWTNEQIASKLGRSPVQVARAAVLARLRQPARRAVQEGRLSPGAALQLARLGVSEELENEALEVLCSDAEGHRPPMSAGQARDWLLRHGLRRLGDAPFSLTDATLVPLATTCKLCPKRSGKQKELFADVREGELCLDHDCWNRKLAAQWTDRLPESRRVEVQFDTLGHVIDPAYVDLDDEVQFGGKETWREVLKLGEGELLYARDGHGNIHEVARRPGGKRPRNAKEEPAKGGDKGAKPKAKGAKAAAVAKVQEVKKEAMELLDAALGRVECVAVLRWRLHREVDTLWRQPLVSFLEVEGGDEKALATLNDAELRDKAHAVVDRIPATLGSLLSGLLELEAHDAISRVGLDSTDVPEYVTSLAKLVGVAK